MSAPTETLMIGIDAGATKIAGALVNTNGQVLVAKRVDTGASQGAEHVILAIAKLANDLIQESKGFVKEFPASLLGIGIGIPGQVNIKTGVVRQAVNLGWDEVPLLSQIQGALIQKVAIAIDTDTNASTMGEYYFGEARGCGNFVFFSIGSGLGAGLFVNGSLVSGTSWKAAELGHISLDPEGLSCKCGLCGCAETIVSGPGLLHLVQKLLEKKPKQSQLSLHAPLTPADIIAAARVGDSLALEAFSEMGRALGSVIAMCMAVTNPGKIIIGGGLGMACFDLILPSVQGEIKRRLLPSLYSHVTIVQSQLGNSAVGAACLLLSHTNDEMVKLSKSPDRRDNDK